MKRIYKLTLLLMVLFHNPIKSSAQVANDSISRRVRLELNQPYILSKTDGCTVEQKCVNQIALKKKITFHNDQWFSFFPIDTNSVYLNIIDQKCRDGRGLQILVFEGPVCQPQLYSYINIKSLLSLDNYTYLLKGLEKNKEYLIQIDGLLGDFCSFELNLTSTPPNYVISTSKREVIPSIEVEKNLVKVA